MKEMDNSPYFPSKPEKVKYIYEKNTKEVRQFGIFGVPSFSINDEIFWGDNRLEDAILFQT